MTRYADASDFTAPPGHCRYCKRKVKPPRRSWCGQECIDEYLVRTSGSHARRAVFDRDQGVCAECGTDTVALARTLVRPVDATRYVAEKGRFRLADGKMIDRWEIERLGHTTPDVEAVVGRLWRGSANSALWDMDHIVPVVEGGGGCGLDNLQTLCLWCHDHKTHRRDETPAQGGD